MSEPQLEVSHALFLSFFAVPKKIVKHADVIDIKFAHMYDNAGGECTFGSNFHFDRSAWGVARLRPGRLDPHTRLRKFYEILPFLVSRIDTPRLLSFEDDPSAAESKQVLPGYERTDDILSERIGCANGRPHGEELGELEKKIEIEFRKWRNFMQENLSNDTGPFNLKGFVVVEMLYKLRERFWSDPYHLFVRLSSQEEGAESAAHAIRKYIMNFDKESLEYQVINTFIQTMCKHRKSGDI